MEDSSGLRASSGAEPVADICVYPFARYVMGRAGCTNCLSYCLRSSMLCLPHTCIHRLLVLHYEWVRNFKSGLSCPYDSSEASASGFFTSSHLSFSYSGQPYPTPGRFRLPGVQGGLSGTTIFMSIVDFLNGYPVPPLLPGSISNGCRDGTLLSSLLPAGALHLVDDPEFALDGARGGICQLVRWREGKAGGGSTEARSWKDPLHVQCAPCPYVLGPCLPCARD